MHFFSSNSYRSVACIAQRRTSFPNSVFVYLVSQRQGVTIFFSGFLSCPKVPHKLFWHGGKLKRDQPRSRAFPGPLRAPPKGILGKIMGQTNIWKRIRKYVRCRPSPHLQKRWQRIRPILGLQAPQNRWVSSSTCSAVVLRPAGACFRYYLQV